MIFKLSSIILTSYLLGGLAQAAVNPNFEQAFQKYYQLTELKAPQCSQLKKLYRDYSKSRESQNKKELANSTVPILHMNAHHLSPYYWKKFQKNNQSYTLFHVDSHSDLAFAPADQKTADQLKKSLKQYPQVIVPALHSGVIDRVSVCQANWNRRLPLASVDYDVALARFPKQNFVRANFDRIYPIIPEQHPLASKNSPFVVLKKDEYKKLKAQTFKIRFFKCYRNFRQHLSDPKQKFIVGIDLDVFSTNGKEGDLALPRSPRRNGETIQRKEFDAVKLRVNHVLNEIKAASKNGFRPSLVSIAASTETKNNSGGNYTPNCLAFLLSYKLESEFKKLYASAKN